MELSENIAHRNVHVFHLPTTMIMMIMIMMIIIIIIMMMIMMILALVWRPRGGERSQRDNCS